MLLIFISVDLLNLELVGMFRILHISAVWFGLMSSRIVVFMLLSMLSMMFVMLFLVLLIWFMVLVIGRMSVFGMEMSTLWPSMLDSVVLVVFELMLVSSCRVLSWSLVY